MFSYNKQSLFLFALIFLVMSIIIITAYRYRALYNPPTPPPQPQKEKITAEEPSHEQPQKEHTTDDEITTDIDTFVRKASEAEIIIDLRDQKAFHNEHIRGSILLRRLSPEEIENAKNVVFYADQSVPRATIAQTLAALHLPQKPVLFIGPLETYVQNGGTTISAHNAQSLRDQATVQYVEPRDLAKRLREKTPTTIIDVRRKGNFAKGHVPQAQNIPFAELEKRYREIARSSAPVYVYGTNQEQSFQAGALLFNLGIFNAKTITGGFDAWKKFNYPIAGEQPSHS